MTRATRTRAQSKASAPGARGRRRPGPTSGATSAKNTPAILQAIVRTAARLCEASNAHIYRVDGDRLRLLAYSGSEPVRHVGQEVPITRELLSGQAVLDRRTIHVRDVQTAAARRRYPGLRGFRHLRSMLAAPLLHDGAAVGLIIIHRSRVRPFTAKQIALLRTFADQAAIALENERLREELEDRNRDLTEALEQQTATSEILRAISSSPTEVGPVFATILDKAMTLVGAQLGVLWRYEGDEMFRAIEVRGARPELRALLQEPQRFGRPLFRTNGPWRPGQIADVRESEPYRRGEPLWVNNADREGMRTLLNVPLVSDARFLGTISLYRREVRAFTGKEIALLQTFADQAVIAIENVRLFTELEARNRDLSEALEQQTATGEILRVLSQSPTDVQPVFDAICRSAVHLCEGVFGTVIEVTGPELRLQAAHGFSRAELEALRQVFPMPLDGQAPSAQAIRDRALLHIPDTEVSSYRDFGRARGFRSIVAIPVFRERQAIAAIAVGRAAAGPFSDRQIALLRIFADQAVIAIENVRLFAELERRNKDLTESLEQQTATSEILRVISGSPTDVQPVFDTIVRSAVSLCGGMFGTAHRFDGELVHLTAHHNCTPEVLDALQRAFPMAPDRRMIVRAGDPDEVRRSCRGSAGGS